MARLRTIRNPRPTRLPRSAPEPEPIQLRIQMAPSWCPCVPADRGIFCRFSSPRRRRRRPDSNPSQLNPAFLSPSSTPDGGCVTTATRPAAAWAPSVVRNEQQTTLELTTLATAQHSSDRVRDRLCNHAWIDRLLQVVADTVAPPTTEPERVSEPAPALGSTARRRVKSVNALLGHTALCILLCTTRTPRPHSLSAGSLGYNY